MERLEASAPLFVAVALGVAAAALSVWLFAPRVAAVSVLLAWSMLAVAVIDARHFIIPDVVSLPAIPAGLLLSGTLVDPSSEGLVEVANVIGVVAGGLALWLVRAGYFFLRRREGLGLGDVKLAAAAGAWTGWLGLSSVLLLAAAMALTFIIALTIMRRAPLSASTKVPFGSFLAPSIWIIWAFDAYLRGL